VTIIVKLNVQGFELGQIELTGPVERVLGAMAERERNGTELR
jgi:hypothetical protein